MKHMHNNQNEREWRKKKAKNLSIESSHEIEKTLIIAQALSYNET